MSTKDILESIKTQLFRLRFSANLVEQVVYWRDVEDAIDEAIGELEAKEREECR